MLWYSIEALIEALLLTFHNICFCEKKKKNIFLIPVPLIMGYVDDLNVSRGYPAKRHFDSTKTCLNNFDPLKPHFYIVKLGLTGVYISFLIFVQKHRLWVLVKTASSRRF